MEPNSKKMTGISGLFRRILSGSASFARPVSSADFIPQIDGLRFLALLLVLAHHVFAAYLVHTHSLGARELPRDWSLIWPRSPLIAWALRLWIGVPIFCVISGFVLTIPFARNRLRGVPPPSRKMYLLRRLIRMEPPYILNLLFLFLVIVFPWHQPHPVEYLLVRSRVFLPHLVASLLYLHAAIYRQASWVNGVAWTLEIEVQFYLLLPFLAELFRIRHTRLRRAILILLVLASTLVSLYLVQPSGSAWLKLSLPVQLQFFIAGVLLADLYLDPPRLLRFGPLAGDAMALFSATALVYALCKERLAWIQPFLIVALCLAILRGAWASRLFRWPPLTIPGAMCYTIYLYHSFVVQRLLPVTVAMVPGGHGLLFDSALQFVLMLPPVLVVSAVLYLVAERPFMILSHEVARRRRASRATAGAVAVARS